MVLLRNLIHTLTSLRDTANKLTSGISGCPKKFKIWEEAQNYYRVEYEQGKVLVKLRK